MAESPVSIARYSAEAGEAAEAAGSDRGEPQWTPQDSADLYRLESWGDSFFLVNEQGHAAVRPFGDDRLAIDFVKLIDELQRRRKRC